MSIMVFYDPGIGKRWAVILVPPGKALGGDYSGSMFTYGDEASQLAADWNETTDDPVANGYRFGPILANPRLRYYIVGRGVLNRLGLVEDVNEFGAISP